MNHKLSGHKHYDKIIGDVNVHGGLTFSNYGRNLINPIFDEDRWYFGFNTAHRGDFVPMLYGRSLYCGGLEDVYRNMNYVKSNVINLYNELKTMS